MTVPLRSTLLAATALVATANAVTLHFATPVAAYPAPIEGEAERLGRVQDAPSGRAVGRGCLPTEERGARRHCNARRLDDGPQPADRRHTRWTGSALRRAPDRPGRRSAACRRGATGFRQDRPLADGRVLVRAPRRAAPRLGGARGAAPSTRHESRRSRVADEHRHAYNRREVDGDGTGDTWYESATIDRVDLRRPFLDGGVRLGFARTTALPPLALHERAPSGLPRG